MIYDLLKAMTSLSLTLHSFSDGAAKGLWEGDVIAISRYCLSRLKIGSTGYPALKELYDLKKE